MKPAEIARVQAYLRRLLGTERIAILAPVRAGASVEVTVNGETVGTLHKDTDEGEVSYSLTWTILEEDLPAPR
jgi:hypothetical protein